MSQRGQRRLRLGLIFLGSLFSLVTIGFFTGKLRSNVTLSWSYDYTPLPACGASQTINCIDHFEVVDLTNGEDPKHLRDVPNPDHPIGLVKNIRVTFRYGPPFGDRMFCVSAVGRDEHGNRTFSNPYAARLTVKIAPWASAQYSQH